MAKKGFQMWMVGALVIPVGIGLSVVNLMNKGTSTMGGSCTQNDDCTKGLQCVQISGRSMCTKQCFVKGGGADYQCPGNFTCENVKMHVGGNEVPMSWCMGK